MRQRVVQDAAAVLYAAAAAGVVVAPALVLELAGRRGGLVPVLHRLDLLVVSAVVGVGYGVVAWSRLRHQLERTRSVADSWIPAVNALVVLALATSLLLGAVLHELGPLRGPLADREWALLLLWGAVHLVAVLLAEVVERLVFRWLLAEPRSVEPPAR